jgi:3-dehydroquinate synthase
MTVQSSTGSYEILRTSLSELKQAIPVSGFVITDLEVASKYGELLPEGRSLVLAPGEENKSLEGFGTCLSWLANQGANRRTTLIALGGGVIGDLVGFVASAYMRGIPYFQIPTTLLAQVDSSVGGKVAIDLPEGKNLAGAFYSPKKVWICGEFLTTLPERQIKNGWAEVLKYGFIANPNLLPSHPQISPLLRPRTYATGRVDDEVVDECIRIKKSIVERDEFETNGMRATLNFGHTIGHAIEVVLAYSELLHGEAISIGMTLEAELGSKIGCTPPAAAKKVRQVLQDAGLPTVHPVLARTNELIAAMYRDKKSIDGTLSMSILEAIGRCKLVTGISEELVRSVLEEGTRSEWL